MTKDTNITPVIPEPVIFALHGKNILNNAFTDKSFKTKRFYKYVDRVKSKIEHNIKSVSKNEDNPINLYNILVINCLTALESQYFNNNPDIESDFEDNLSGFYNLTDVPVYTGAYTGDSNCNIIETLNQFNDSNGEQYPDIYIKLAEKEFENECIRFLINKYAITSDKDKFVEGYSSKLPSTLDQTYMIKNCQSRLYADIVIHILDTTIKNAIIVEDDDFSILTL